MKKLNLNETIDRIRQLNYSINEQLGNLFKTDTEVDEPKKADLVSDDVTKLIDTLSDASNQGGLKQEKSGSMQYQKSVESLQIALILLGYELPLHGVDGLYGPETAAAVQKFNRDNNITNDSSKIVAESLFEQFKTDDIIKDTFASPKTLQKLILLLKQKNIKSQDIKPFIDKNTSGNFINLDLNTNQGVKTYAKIAQAYINTKNKNLLNITGQNLATAAKKTFDKYNKFVPLELALAQLTLEGGFSNDPNSRPIRTNNPFNIGNVDSGGNIKYSNVQAAIDAYYDLIAKRYIGNGKSASDLVNNFVDIKGARYASSTSYETQLNKIITDINKIGLPLYKQLNNNALV